MSAEQSDGLPTEGIDHRDDMPLTLLLGNSATCQVISALFDAHPGCLTRGEIAQQVDGSATEIATALAHLQLVDIATQPSRGLYRCQFSDVTRPLYDLYEMLWAAEHPDSVFAAYVSDELGYDRGEVRSR